MRAGRWSTITYTITVTNTGDEDLEDITVDDTLLGRPVETSARHELAAGDSESHDFTYTVTANSPDPVPNAVTATGAGVISDRCRGSTRRIVLHGHPQPRRSSRQDLHPTAQVGDAICLHDHGHRTPATRTSKHHRRRHACSANLSGSFADTLAAGASESARLHLHGHRQQPGPVSRTR